jgi:hypothetical protein
MRGTAEKIQEAADGEEDDVTNVHEVNSNANPLSDDQILLASVEDDRVVEVADNSYLVDHEIALDDGEIVTDKNLSVQARASHG